MRPEVDPIAEATLLRQFTADFAALQKSPIPVQLVFTRLQCWVIFSQIQLALRHPENTGPTAKIARAIADLLQAQITVTPALQEIARRGWHRSMT